MPKGKAQADAKAQHTCKYVSILRRFATPPLGIRCIFEIGSSIYSDEFYVTLQLAIQKKNKPAEFHHQAGKTQSEHLQKTEDFGLYNTIRRLERHGKMSS